MDKIGYKRLIPKFDIYQDKIDTSFTCQDKEVIMTNCAIIL